MREVDHLGVSCCPQGDYPLASVTTTGELVNPEADSHV
jgi:hypothetical protein